MHRIVRFMLDEEHWSDFDEGHLTHGHHGVILVFLALFLLAVLFVGSRLV